MDGWTLDEEQLTAAFDRAAQLDARRQTEVTRQAVEPATYLNASAEQRLDFAQLLLNKELLLRLAREACPEPDSLRARRFRIQREKRLVNGFLDHQRQSFRVTKEEGEQIVQRLSRRVQVTRAEIADANQQKVQEAMAAGGDFETVARAYAVGPVEQATLDITDFDAETAGRVFVPEVPEGRSFGPVRTRTGLYLFRVDGFEPFSLQADPALLTQANRMVDAIVFFPRNRAWVDSLQAAAQIGFHRDSFPLIQGYFAAFWDSVETERRAGAVVNYQEFRSPTWLVPEAEAGMPLYDLWGETHSIMDFMRSIDLVDLDLWPTTGELSRIAFKIEGRVLRLLWADEAKKTGYADTEEFHHALEQLDEKELLDQYRFRYLIPQLEITEAEVRAEYDEHPDRYRSIEQVAFGVLLFAPDMEAQARQAYAKVRDADPLRWYEVGPEAAQDPRVIFEPDTGLRDINQAPERPEWAPFRDIARTQEVGQLSDLLKTPNGFAIVRTNQRVPSQRLSFEDAKANARRALENRKVDEIIDARLAEARDRWDAELYPETLGIVQNS